MPIFGHGNSRDPMGKRTDTHKRWIHILHIVLLNVPRGAWWQVGRVWGPNDVTPMFYKSNEWTTERVFVSWLKRSCVWGEATGCNGWIRWMTRAWSWVNQSEKKCLRKKNNVFRAKKQTEWETVDHCHARGGGWLSNDWLEKNKEKKRLNDKWDVCDALVVSRPWTIVYKTVRLKSSLGWTQNDLGSNAFLWKRFEQMK